MFYIPFILFWETLTNVIENPAAQTIHVLTFLELNKVLSWQRQTFLFLLLANEVISIRKWKSNNECNFLFWLRSLIIIVRAHLVHKSYYGKTPQNQKYFKEYGCVWTSVLYIKCSCFNNNEQRGRPIFLPNTGDYTQAQVRYSLH